MSLIKARTRGKHMVRHITRFDRETNETLYAYAHFLGEPTEYVLNQLVDRMLAKDKEFLEWRAEHSESYVPHRTARTRQRQGLRSSHRTGHTTTTPPDASPRAAALP